MATATARRLTSYGRVQFPDRLGLGLGLFERARRDGLIPDPDRADERWSAAVVAEVEARLDLIREAVGTQPDVGAHAAAELLAARFGVDVDTGVLVELDRRGLVKQVGEYRGHPMYDGRALERFTDRAVLLAALAVGRLLTTDQAAAHLHVRRADVGHLVRAGLLTPAKWARNPHRSKRSGAVVKLYRVGDLDTLAADQTIDWAAVRATPRGRPSPLAALPDAPR